MGAFWLGLPGAASAAATFYVDDSATAPAAPCIDPDPAKACTSIQTAIVQARDGAFPGGDTIQVAAGTYNEIVTLNVDQDSGNVLDGAGAASVINYQTNILCCAVLLGGTAPPAEDALTLRDFRVVVPASTPEADKSAIIVNATNTTIQNVTVDLERAGSPAAAVRVSGGPTTIDGLVASTVGTGAALSKLGTEDLTLRNSVLETDLGLVGLQATNAAAVGAATLRVERTRIGVPAAAFYALSADNHHLTMFTSLLTGGGTGIRLVASTAPTNSTIRNTTIDAATSGVADGTGVSQRTEDAAGSGSAALQSTIAVETQASVNIGTSSASVTCQDSDVPSQQQTQNVSAGTISCSSGGAGNSSSAVGALFVGGSPFSHRLLANAPAVDTGSAAALDVGEPQLDLDGLLRVVDGNAVSGARRDKGAYEFQPTSPVAAATHSPDPALVGQAVTFDASASSDPNPGDALSFAWSFDDGGAAAGATVQHAFSTPGAHTATVTVTDLAGRTASTTRTVTVNAPASTAGGGGGGGAATGAPSDLLAPSLGASMSPTAFAPGGSGIRFARVPRGTRFLLTLSEPATIAIAIERPRPGRRVGRRCRPPTRANRSRPRCTRYVRLGAATVRGTTGRNRVRFSGRVRGRALAPDRYRAVVQARDSAGNRSPRRLLGFRILRG